MDALTVQGQELQPAHFEAFIQYIDRPARTTRTYITNLRQFAAWLAYSRTTQPQRREILLYRDYLSAEHEAIKLDPGSPGGWSYRTDGSGNRYTVICRPNTVKQYLQSVRQFFSWTAAAGLYPNIAAGVHVPKIRQDTHRKEALTAADVLAIEQSITATAAGRSARAAAAPKDTAGRITRANEQGKRLAAMYSLAVNAGLRTIELSRANVRDLEIKNGRAVLYVWGKGHTEPDAKKPLAPEVYQILREYLDARSDRPTPGSPLFVATGNRSGGRRIAETTISKQLKEALRGAGYNSDRITAHSLRHTAGTAVQEITGNLYITQKYMRHSSPTTTEIYLHVDTERQEADTAQRLYSYYHGKEHNGRSELENILQTMSAEQIEQLAGIAAAIAG